MSHDSVGSTWGALTTEWSSDFDTWANAFATELASAIRKHSGGKSYARKMRLRVDERNKLFFTEAQLQTIVKGEVVYDLEKLYEAIGITVDEMISLKKLKEHIKKKLWERLLEESKRNSQRIKLIKNKEPHKFSNDNAKYKKIGGKTKKLTK
tara:strand:- start:965 stop:1420 length:456 start_codon:yes stop_codon:yes gene_type:complete